MKKTKNMYLKKLHTTQISSLKYTGIHCIFGNKSYVKIQIFLQKGGRAAKAIDALKGTHIFLFFNVFLKEN